MELPSNKQVSRDLLIDMFETVVTEKFTLEASYADAFQTLNDNLAEGTYEELGPLDDTDITAIYDELSDVVIECEGKLRAVLGEYERECQKIRSW